MQSAKTTQTKSTADQIIGAAAKLFAAKGYEGVSTKEICENAGVNIAAIHYHFGSKEGLLRHILEDFGGASLRSVQRILVPASTTDEFRVRIKMFLEEMLDSYLSNPDFWRIAHIEVELMHTRSRDVFEKFFIKRTECLIAFLDQAKKDRILSKEVDTFFAARTLFSQICHQTRLDHVFHTFYKTSFRDEKYRSLWIKQTLEIFINGIGR